MCVCVCVRVCVLARGLQLQHCLLLSGVGVLQPKLLHSAALRLLKALIPFSFFYLMLYALCGRSVGARISCLSLLLADWPQPQAVVRCSFDD